MHKESLDHMRINLQKYLNYSAKILDIGSLNYRNKKGNYLGCYKSIILPDHKYIGIDIVPGENVDVVTNNPYSFPFLDNSFDAIITGQCLEHVQNPFKLMRECFRLITPGGWFIGVAPYKWEIHRVPVDCWRIQPDGWEALFDEVGLKKIEIYLNDIDLTRGDCWGIAQK